MFKIVAHNEKSASVIVFELKIQDFERPDMTESYNTTCMQRHLIDLGTTVPPSLRVFTPDALFREQSKFISASMQLDFGLHCALVMEARQANGLHFSIRAQAPEAPQSLFGFTSASAVEVLPSFRVAVEFTAASKETQLFVSSRSTALPQWGIYPPISFRGSLDSGTVISVRGTFDFVRSLSRAAAKRASASADALRRSRRFEVRHNNCGGLASGRVLRL